MGTVWKPNKANNWMEFSICFSILTLEWDKTPNTNRKKIICIVSTTCLLILGYFIDHCGEELCQIHLGMIQKNGLSV